MDAAAKQRHSLCAQREGGVPCRARAPRRRSLRRSPSRLRGGGDARDAARSYRRLCRPPRLQSPPAEVATPGRRPRLAWRTGTPCCDAWRPWEDQPKRISRQAIAGRHPRLATFWSRQTNPGWSRLTIALWPTGFIGIHSGGVNPGQRSACETYSCKQGSGISVMPARAVLGACNIMNSRAEQGGGGGVGRRRRSRHARQ